MTNVLIDRPACILNRLNLGHTDAISFDCAVVTLDLAVALRVVRRRFHMRHSCDPNELFEVPRNELRTVVGDDSRLRFGVLFTGSLQNHFHAGFFHFLAYFPVNDASRTAIEHHKRKSTVALERISVMEVKNRLLLPSFHPEISRNRAVVLVDFAVAFLPVVELAGSDPNPLDDFPGWRLGTLGPSVVGPVRRKGQIRAFYPPNTA